MRGKRRTQEELNEAIKLLYPETELFPIETMTGKVIGQATKEMFRIVQGKYLVGNKGTIMKVENSKLVKIPPVQKTDTGAVPKSHWSIWMKKDGDDKWTTYSIHRLVADCFVPKPAEKNKISVNHIDENPLNNDVDNLEWCTVAENSTYSLPKTYEAYKEKKLIDSYAHKIELPKPPFKDYIVTLHGLVLSAYRDEGKKKRKIVHHYQWKTNYEHPEAYSVLFRTNITSCFKNIYPFYIEDLVVADFDSKEEAENFATTLKDKISGNIDRWRFRDEIYGSGEVEGENEHEQR